MASSECIEQQGVIEEIENGYAKVRISSTSACQNCYAKAVCGIDGGSARYVEAPVSAENCHVGEHVYITMKRTLGMKATLIAYVLPFALVTVLLLVLTGLKIHELYSGVISLVAAAAYFLGLYFFRGRLNRAFIFTLRKTG